MDFSAYGFSGLARALNVHPAFVHFPIALLPTAFFFYAIGVVIKKPMLLAAGRGCLYLGFVSVIITVLTGLAAKDTFPHNEAIHRMIEVHEKTGFMILGLSLVLSAWSFWAAAQRPKWAWGFVAGLLVASYLVLQNGDIGSRMVYLHGAAVKPALPAIKAGEGHPH